MPKAPPKPKPTPGPMPESISIRSFPGPIAAVTEADYMRDRGLRRGKLSSRNASQLVHGIPEPLVVAVYRINRLTWEPLLSGDKAWDRRFLIGLADNEASRIRRNLVAGLIANGGWRDRGSLYFKADRDHKPHVIVGHPHEVTPEDLEQLKLACAFWNLRYEIGPESWYLPGKTVRVELTRGEPDATLPEITADVLKLIKPRSPAGPSHTANPATADDRPVAIG